MKKYVTGFLFSEDGKNVLLIQKLSPQWQHGLYNGIGGKVEVNELPAIAMSRECLEETGLTIVPSSWIKLLTILVPERNEIDFFYSFSNELYNAKQLEKEKLFIADTQNLPKKIINNLRWMIPMALDDRLEKNIAPVLLEKRSVPE